MIKILNFVSAHTGNDYYYHGMETFDWIIGFFILIFLIVFIVWIIKKKKKK